MKEVLIKDERLGGRFVAIKDFDDKTLIDDGKTPNEVLE